MTYLLDTPSEVCQLSNQDLSQWPRPCLFRRVHNVVRMINLVKIHSRYHGYSDFYFEVTFWA